MIPFNPGSKIISLILVSVLAVFIAHRKVPMLLSSTRVVTLNSPCPKDPEEQKIAIRKYII